MRIRVCTAAVLAAVAASAFALLTGNEAQAAPKLPASDFNGDGYRDLVIGAPNGTVNGHVAAGYVVVVYGSASGLDTSHRQVISQDSSGLPGSPEGSDHFGYATAATDANDDGYADLAIGVPGEDLAYKNAGWVTLMYGSPSGLGSATSTVEGDWTDAWLGGSLAAGDFNRDGAGDFAVAGGDTFTTIYGSRESARLTVRQSSVHDAPQVATRAAASDPIRSSVAVGDVNNDGYADAAWQMNHDSSVDVFLGSATGIMRQTGDRKGMLGGSSVAIADVNGDHYADVIVGRPYSSGHKGGAVSVWPGTSKGINLWSYHTITQSSSGVPGASEDGDGFGYALSATDLTGDGRAEIAVGVAREDIDGHVDAGAVVVLRGSSSWALGNGARVFSQHTSGVPGAAERGDRFGAAVAFNDYNSDGRPDLVAGAPGENGGSGAVTVLRGSTGWLTTSGARTFGAATVGSPRTGAAFGASLVS
jgi:hypothetical protein